MCTLELHIHTEAACIYPNLQAVWMLPSVGIKVLRAPHAGAPTVIICAIGAATIKLRHEGIDVLDPSKMKVAADVNVVCFDKTGTLTGSVVSLWRCQNATCHTSGHDPLL